MDWASYISAANDVDSGYIAFQINNVHFWGEVLDADTCLGTLYRIGPALAIGCLSLEKEFF